uniref:Fibroblast growth factor binding protein 1a n=1 Tax=Labrus bergylta TaxID=56723 RepID=A0A3Q3GFB2_9LABR
MCTKELLLLLFACCVWSAESQGAGRRQNIWAEPIKFSTKSKDSCTMVVTVVTKGELECTWAATGEDVFILGVSCKKGGKSFSCEYVSRPTLCPQFASDAKLYWKQIARALKKQKNLCQDGAALVRAGMCRRADRGAHFRLRNTQRKTKNDPPPPPSPQPAPGAVKSCQSDNMKLAEEYCNRSWSSVCTFFFTMVQDYDC